MTIKVQKWGNSLGIQIPNHIDKQVFLQDGDELVITVDNPSQSIILKRKSHEPTLDELLSQITDDNRHDEMIIGRVGSVLY